MDRKDICPDDNLIYISKLIIIKKRGLKPVYWYDTCPDDHIIDILNNWMSYQSKCNPYTLL